MDLIEKVMRASIPLRKTNPQNYPIDIGSGCFLIYKGVSFFLTVRHIYENQDIGIWNILIGCELNEANGKINAKMKPLPSLTGMNRFQLCVNPTPNLLENLQEENCEEILPKLGAKNVDFVFQKMDFVTCHIDFFTDAGIFSVPLIPLSDDLNALPDENKRYTFFGNTKPYENAEKLDRVEGTDSLCHIVTPTFISDMKYIKKANGMLEFELPKNKDREELAGCSGAPILDEDGNLVSLVVEMDHEEEKVIERGRYMGKRIRTKLYGVDLQIYKTALDVAAGVID